MGSLLECVSADHLLGIPISGSSESFRNLHNYWSSSSRFDHKQLFVINSVKQSNTGELQRDVLAVISQTVVVVVGQQLSVWVCIKRLNKNRSRSLSANEQWCGRSYFCCPTFMSAIFYIDDVGGALILLLKSWRVADALQLLHQY